ncbi:hypothetical protein N2152v2_004457 [Parachlorella kessleri]
MGGSVPDPVAVLRGHHAEVQALDFLDTEAALLAGDGEGELRVWGLQDLRPVAVSRTHPASGGILHLESFSWRERQYLVTQGKDMTVHVWQLGTDLHLARAPLVTIHKMASSFCRFSLLAPLPPGPHAAVSRQPHAAPPEQGGSLPAAAITLRGQVDDDSQHDVSGTADTGSPAHQSADGGQGQPAQPRETLAAPSGLGGICLGLHCCTCSPAGACAEGGQGDLPAEHVEQQQHAQAQGQRVQAVGSGAPYLLALPADDNRAVDVWCCGCGRQLVNVGQPGAAWAEGSKLGMCTALKLFRNPSGPPCLAAGYEAGWVVVWALYAGGATSSSASRGDSNGTTGKLSSSDGLLGAMGRLGGSGEAPAGVHQQQQQPLAARQLHEEPVLCIDIDASGAGGASAGADSRLVLFKLDWGAGGAVKVRKAVPLKAPGVNAVAIRGDGRIIATAGWDGRVRVFKYRTGEPLAVLKYHRSAMTAVRFSPKTHLLASASQDGTIALWSIYQERKHSQQ